MMVDVLSAVTTIEVELHDQWVKAHPMLLRARDQWVLQVR
jgi:hypothetical protein